MSVIVPDQVNHRRRVLYAALSQIVGDKARVDTIFELCDPLVREEHFLASRIAEYVMRTGLLGADERIPLTRALMQHMKLSYQELPKFPNDLVLQTVGGVINREFEAEAPAESVAAIKADMGIRPTLADEVAAGNGPDLRGLRAAKHATILDVDPISLKRIDVKQNNPLFPNAQKRKPETEKPGGFFNFSFFGLDLGKLLQRRPKHKEYTPVRVARTIHSISPNAKVFRTVVSAVVEAIQETAPQFERMILDIANQSAHKSLVQPVLQPWVDAGLAPPALAANLSLPQMRGIINILYLCACQIVGPLEADRLVAAAISQAEGLPEAEEFDPRQLF
ncbi:MAG: hypothetical protein SFU83_23220 [Meiothermus sp.]|nr:hypothetical protein [Meiothermus sp.]